jgi:hypothetical protein
MSWIRRNGSEKYPNDYVESSIFVEFTYGLHSLPQPP